MLSCLPYAMRVNAHILLLVPFRGLGFGLVVVITAAAIAAVVICFVFIVMTIPFK